MTRLFLVRHAHADWVPEESRPLSSRGRRDALRVADALAHAGVAAIYSSPARRALETVEPLARRLRLAPVLIADLREREMPARPDPEFQAGVRASWRQPEAVVGGAEALSAAQARALATVRSIVSRHGDQSIVASTHGNLLALIVNGMDSTCGYEFWKGLTFPDIYELRFSGASLATMLRVWEGAAPRGADVEGT